MVVVAQAVLGAGTLVSGLIGLRDRRVGALVMRARVRVRVRVRVMVLALMVLALMVLALMLLALMLMLLLLRVTLRVVNNARGARVLKMLRRR